MNQKLYFACAIITILSLNGCRSVAPAEKAESEVEEPVIEVPASIPAPPPAPPPLIPVQPPQRPGSAEIQEAELAPEAAAIPKELFSWEFIAPAYLRAQDSAVLQVNLKPLAEVTPPLRLRWSIRQNGRDCEFGGSEPVWMPVERVYQAQIPFQLRNAGAAEILLSLSDVNAADLGQAQYLLSIAPFGEAQTIALSGVLPPQEEKFIAFNLPADVATEALHAQLQLTAPEPLAGNALIAYDGGPSQAIPLADGKVDWETTWSAALPGQHNIGIKTVGTDQKVSYRILLSYYQQPRNQSAAADAIGWSLERNYYLLEPVEDPEDGMVVIDGISYRRIPVENLANIPHDGIVESALTLVTPDIGRELVISDPIPAGFQPVGETSGREYMEHSVTDAHGRFISSHRMRAKFSGNFHVPPATVQSGALKAASATTVLHSGTPGF